MRFACKLVIAFAGVFYRFLKYQSNTAEKIFSSDSVSKGYA